MTRFLSAKEIAALGSPDLPGTVQKITALAVANGWRADPAKARRAEGRGGGWVYNPSILPPGAQARAALKYGSAALPAVPAQPQRDEQAWARFEALPATQKDEARRRLAALEAFEQHRAAGRTSTAAAALTAAQFDTSSATIFNWRKAIAGLERADRLPALAPAYRPTAAFSECHPKAWEAFTSDYLRPEAPRLSASYRRTRKLASKNGWLPFPSERSLRRRLEAEVPAAVQTLAREGRDKAKTLYPAQRRSRASLTAMQAVNMDGHKIDVFVKLARDGRVTRMHLLALQDLHSGMFVAWRLAETENKETVRLVIGDMVERWGIPDRIVLDNGRAFASKWISGGTPNRYRFKVRDEDPRGLLTTLGVDIVYTKPYSGQSKPIERAFGDLAEEIGKHPLCAGAYTGNSPEAKPENYASRAIDEAVFRTHVDAIVAEHNERPGRLAANCAGRSFRETFEASLADPATIVTQASAAQRSLWLLAAERVRAKRGSGEIVIFENRYWAPQLNALAGQLVTVRFDPEHLDRPVKVYDAADRLVCEAEAVGDVEFFSAEGARATERDRAAYLKALRQHEALRDKLSADQLARLHGADTPAAPAASAPRPKVARLAAGGARPAPSAAAQTDNDLEASFSRAVRALDAGEVIPFIPKRSAEG